MSFGKIWQMRLIGTKLKNRDKVRRAWKDIPTADQRTIVFVFFNLIFGAATPYLSINLYRYFAGLPKTSIEYPGEILVFVLSGALYIYVLVSIKKRWSANE